MKTIRFISLAALIAALTASAWGFPNTTPPYAGWVTADEYGSRNAELYARPAPSPTVAVYAHERRPVHHGKWASARMHREAGRGSQQ
jgi:hypothetical protein